MSTAKAPTSSKQGQKARSVQPMKPGARRGSSWAPEQVESLLRVSSAAATQSQLKNVLNTIAVEACRVTRAAASSILSSDPDGALRLAAASGLSKNYHAFLRGSFIRHGMSASRAAVQARRPVVIEDVIADPLANRPEAVVWMEFALREQYRAVMAIPLIVRGQRSGVLNLYRRQPGPWTKA